MKIRNGFVSNSSSSSFTCHICGNEESGRDCGLEDLGFMQCVNEHIFCDRHFEYPDNEKCLDFLKNNIDIVKEKLKDFQDSVEWMKDDIEKYKDDTYTVTRYKKDISEIEEKINIFLDVIQRIETDNFEDFDAQDIVSEYFISNDEVEEYFCPICSFQELDLDDIKRYIIKKYNITENEIFAEIKKQNPRRRKLYIKEFIDMSCKKIGTDNIEDEIKSQFKNLSEFDSWLFEN